MAERNDVLRKVQALLDKAASTGFTAEAESLRAKADELMTKYMVEEHELRSARPVSERSTPEKRLVKIVGPNSPIWEQMGNLTSIVAKHCGCRIIYHGWTDKGKYGLGVTVYGFTSDLDWFELLFASLSSSMANEMEPRPTPEMTDDEKIEMLRAAGIPWPRVYEICGWDQTYGFRAIKAYRKVHRDNLGLKPSTFMKSFIGGFNEEINKRLYDLRKSRQTETPGMALVLVDRSSEVSDFYESSIAGTGVRSARTTEPRFVATAHAAGRKAGAKADIGQTKMGGNARGRIGS